MAWIQCYGKCVVLVRAHHMFSRILNFLFVIVFFREQMIFLIKKLTVILAFCNLFWFLNENLFQRDPSKQQISLGGKKSEFVDSGFVKTCNELVLGVAMWVGQHVLTVALQTTAMRQVTRIRYLNSPQKFCFSKYVELIR